MTFRPDLTTSFRNPAPVSITVAPRQNPVRPGWAACGSPALVREGRGAATEGRQAEQAVLKGFSQLGFAGLSMLHEGQLSAIDPVTGEVTAQVTTPGMRFGVGAGVLFSLATLGSLISGYHGYKRNDDSVAAGVGWGVLGWFFPIITVPVALAQGYAKRK